MCNPSAPQTGWLAHPAWFTQPRHASADGSLAPRSIGFGKHATSLRFLATITDDRQRLTPGRLLGVVDLAQIEHLTLEHLAAHLVESPAATGHTPALDDAEVAMLLAVLPPLACLR
jgi:hypothetical protein